VDLAYDKEEIAAEEWGRVGWKLRRLWATAWTQGEDVEPGEKN